LRHCGKKTRTYIRGFRGKFSQRAIWKL